MGQVLPFRTIETAVVKADGTARIDVGPTSYAETWQVQKVSCQISTNVSQSTFSTFIDGVFAGGSYSGDMDTDTAYNETLSSQSVLSARWVDADVGATATLTVSGTKTIGI